MNRGIDRFRRVMRVIVSGAAGGTRVSVINGELCAKHAAQPRFCENLRAPRSAGFCNEEELGCSGRRIFLVNYAFRIIKLWDANKGGDNYTEHQAYIRCNTYELAYITGIIKLFMLHRNSTKTRGKLDVSRESDASHLIYIIRAKRTAINLQ